MLKTTLQYYGISPWEVEVLYGYLNSHFTVIQDEIEPNDENFVSFLEMISGSVGRTWRFC